MKTKEEEHFEALLDKYFDKFDTNYPLNITSTLSTADHITRIEQAIASGVPAEETQTDDDVTY